MSDLDYSSDNSPISTTHEMRVRCPSCMKSYRILSEDIKEARPQFKCSDCDNSFWVPFPEALDQGEIIGFPLSWLKPRPVEATPKLSAQSMNTTKGGPHETAPDLTLIRGSASSLPPMDSYPAPHTVKSMWSEVVRHYEDVSRHDDFLALCQKEGVLAYAAFQYRRVLSAVGEDEMAERQLRAVEALVEAPMASQRQVQTIKFSRTPFRLRAFHVATLVAVLLVVLGFAWPPYRNLVGMGAAVLFLNLFFWRLAN